MKHLGLRARILLITSAFLLVTNIALGTALTRQSQKAMKTQIDERMLDVVKTAAVMLDGDVLEHLSAEDKYAPEYQAVVNTLNRFRDNINLAYIYCVRDMGNKSFVFTIDSDAVDPAEFGSPVAYTDALYNASLGIPSVDDKPYEDRWGRFYSAYSPVYTSEGKVGGVVAVDFEASWYMSHLNQNTLTTIIACVLSLSVSIGLTLFMTRQFSSRIEQINANLSDLESDMLELYRNSPLIKQLKDEVIPQECSPCPRAHLCKGGAKCLTYAVTLRQSGRGYRHMLSRRSERHGANAGGSPVSLP